MGKRIPIDISTVPDLSARVEYELDKIDDKIELSSKRGIVADKRLANSSNSYLYVSGTKLMFFNAQTGQTNAVKFE